MPPEAVTGVPSSTEPNAPTQRFVKDDIDAQNRRAIITERKLSQIELNIYGPP
jgi:hypothetical protein